MPLQCKNCGGNIYLDDQTKKLTCDSCGVSQDLNALSDEMIFNEADVPSHRLNAYHRAITQLASANTEKSLLMVADLFRSAGDLFNAPQLADECRERANFLEKERHYNQALDWMQNDEPDQVKKAVELFEKLEGYRDANSHLPKAKKLLEEVTVQYEQRMKREAIRKRKKKNRLILFIALIIITILFVNFSLHRPGNIKIALSPKESGYVTKKYNDYVFNYDMKIKNKSLMDVTAIEAEILFEKQDGTVLIDADFNAGSTISQSKPVVRGKKTSQYTWSVTVLSDSTALELYEQDFDDLKIKIKIKTLRFGDGKVRHY